MAPKQTPRQGELTPPEAPPPPIATTYYARSTDKTWEVWKVAIVEEVSGRHSMTETLEFSHPSLVVARQRLMVLLDKVLP